MTTDNPSTTTTTTATAEEETRWTDDRIRWSDCEEEDDDDDADSDEAALIDPFKDPDPFETFSFTFPGPQNEMIDVSIRGYKTDSDQVWKSTGLTLWRASEYLCQYMAKHAQLLQGKRVLELGAGLGLCGVLAYRLGSNVCLTDGDTDALVYLRENVQRNTCTRDGCGTVSCRQLLWGQETSMVFLEKHAKGELYDVLLASDIIYAECIIQPLWETVQTLLSRPNGVFIMAFARRKVPVSIDFVLSSAQQAGFSYKRVDEGDAEGIFIYEFRWEKNEEAGAEKE